MRYERTVSGYFEKRLNRFSAQVWLDGILETVHVKNTGRLGELLIPGAEVTLQKAENPERVTKYDLISIKKEGLGWVNIDSQVPNKVVHEWLKEQDYTYIKPEYKYGESRLDFYMEKGEKKYLMEVKGCTLMEEGTCYFPDSKSVRAVKHIHELIHGVKEGYHGIIAFVIALPGGKEVHPNVKKDPDFAAAMELAKENGVEVWHFACDVSNDSIKIISSKKD